VVARGRGDCGGSRDVECCAHALKAGAVREVASRGHLRLPCLARAVGAPPASIVSPPPRLHRDALAMKSLHPINCAPSPQHTSERNVCSVKGSSFGCSSLRRNLHDGSFIQPQDSPAWHRIKHPRTKSSRMSSPATQMEVLRPPALSRKHCRSVLRWHHNPRKPMRRHKKMSAKS
jgi:hypothetical protein